MYIFWFLFVTLATCAPCKPLPWTKGSKIVNGNEAAEGDYPWMVSLQLSSFFGRYHFCGGSIVDEYTVITAAHCLDDVNPVGIWVVAGEYKLNEVSGNEQALQVSEAFVHPNYLPNVISSDIAILKFNRAFKLNEKVTSVLLPDSNFVAEPGTNVTVIGWGLMEENGDIPDTLRYATLPIIPDDLCRALYNDADTDYMQCAGYIQGGSDSCQGDSGGPLMTDDVMIGIVSWGYGCGRPGFPGVYTKVSKFIDWIATFIS